MRVPASEMVINSTQRSEFDRSSVGATEVSNSSTGELQSERQSEHASFVFDEYSQDFYSEEDQPFDQPIPV